MSFGSFIENLWVARLLSPLRKKHSFMALTNRNYEGEVQGGGSSVTINEISDASISDYTDSAGVTFERANMTGQTLLIDQQKSFSFDVSDIDMAQAKDSGELMNKLMESASYGIQNAKDIKLGSLYASAGIVGNGSTTSGHLGTSAVPLEITADGGSTSIKPSEWLSRMLRRMEDANVPVDMLKISAIVPPWLRQKMILEKILLRGVINDEDFRTGKIDEAMGFRILTSNNISTSTTKYRVLAGNPNCMTLADQIAKVEVGRRESYFRDFVKGLYVYGVKVIRPDQLLLTYVTEGAEAQ